jgi:hypothetical protein
MFPEAVTNPDARGPEAKNTIGAQIDRNHMYLTCHVEVLEKGKVISKNQLSKNHAGTFTALKF